MIIIYCVIGVEYNEYNMANKISILGSFTNQDEALKFRTNQPKYTNVDIIETTIDDSNDNLENEMQL